MIIFIDAIAGKMWPVAVGKEGFCTALQKTWQAAQVGLNAMKPNILDLECQVGGFGIRIVSTSLFFAAQAIS